MTDHPDLDPNIGFDDDRDLDAVRALRADVAAPDPTILAAAKARLADQDVRPAVLVRHRRPRPLVLRRRALIGIAAAAAVAAIASGAYVLTSDTDGRIPDRSPQAAPTTGRGTPSTARTSTPAVIRFATVAQLLDAASAGAVGATAPLGEGEYRHVRTHSLDLTTIEEPPDDGAYQVTENRNDSWTPASGPTYQRNDNNISVDYPTARQRRFAANSPGGIPERELTWYEIDGKQTTQLYPERRSEPTLLPCDDCPDSLWDTPETVDTSELSRDPDALRDSLYAWAKKTYKELVGYGKGDQFTVDDLAFDAVTRAASRPDLPGDLRAELYQVIKTIPGITLTQSLANYDGVTGVAVGRADTFHVRHDLIFTGNGSTYIGDRTVAEKPSREYRVKAGTLIGATAVTVTITGKPALPRR